MSYTANFDGSRDLQGNVRGWRIAADYTAQGGTVIDICGASNEMVARETALAMSQMRRALS